MHEPNEKPAVDCNPRRANRNQTFPPSSSLSN
jgi:hypothetical protein